MTTYWKHRIIVLGNWAAGSLAIGLGVIPLVAGLTALFRAPGEEPSRELRMFRCVTLAGLIGVGMYTGDEGRVPLDGVRDARRGAEHHLRRAAAARRHGDRPRAAARQLLGARRRDRLRRVPRRIRAVPPAVPVRDGRPALLGRARPRDPAAGEPLPLLDAVHGASGCCSPSLVGGVVALVAMPALRRGRRLAGAIAAVLALGIVAWNLTGEISAAAGTNSISRTAAATLRHPFTWVDDITHQQPTIYLGEGEADQNPEWMLEFWNRSIVTVGSLDGSVGGPGPAGSPNLAANGTHLLDRRSGEPGPAVRLRGRGLAVRRLRRDVPRQALLPRRRRHEGLASRSS